MAKYFVFLAIFVTLLTPKTVFASEVAGNSGALKVPEVRVDTRPQRLASFLESMKSPLAPYAQAFVEAADRHQIDWRLLAAIAGVESTFGQYMITDTYNAYGWGGGTIRFKSWEDSIDQVSKALAEKYYAQGRNTPAKIGPVYCPPNPTWSKNVSWFMEKIENYQENLDISKLNLTI